jgi:succinyl-CoA synthetase beta subunit
MYEKFDKQMDISGVTGNLNVFLIEDFIPHSKEYYISFSAERDCDIVNFSLEG